MKCFVLLATLVAAVAAESGADAEAGFFNGFGGQYGYPGYAHHGYAQLLLASSYSTHSYHPYPAYHGGYPAAAYAAAAYAPRVAYPAVPNQPIAAPAPYAVAAPAPIAPAPFAPAAFAAQPAVPAPYAAAPLAAAPLAAAPLAPALPVGTTASQFHSQDEFGNFDYSYSNINSAKHETGNGRTGVTGTYSYVDGFGAPQRVDYVADDFGFRATGTNFPTTAANLGLHRRRRELIAPAPIVAPYAIAPTVSAPAGHEAILTRIQLNPGHAVAYRVF
jgi:hypothetical protein